MYLEFFNDLFTSNSSIDFLMSFVRFFCRLTPISTADSSRRWDPSLSPTISNKKRIELPNSHIDRPSMSKWFARDLLLLRLFFSSFVFYSFRPVVCSSRRAYVPNALSLPFVHHATQHQPDRGIVYFPSVFHWAGCNRGKQGGLYGIEWMSCLRYLNNKGSERITTTHNINGKLTRIKRRERKSCWKENGCRVMTSVLTICWAHDESIMAGTRRSRKEGMSSFVVFSRCRRHKSRGFMYASKSW